MSERLVDLGLVENVARAILAERHSWGGVDPVKLWGALTVAERDRYMREAHAALAAAGVSA